MCLPQLLEHLLSPRQVLDVYYVKKQIGHGNFGKVHLIVHKVTGETVALKVMHSPAPTHFLMNKRLIEKGFMTEIQALELLVHPNIVKMCFAHNSCLYPRKYLGHRVTTVIGLEVARNNIGECGIFPPWAVKVIMSQLLSALAYCHKNGVSHRDIKIENLLVSQDYTILLSDFNICTSKERTRTFCGSLHYMAPEIDPHHRRYYCPKKADIWSTGVCFYYLVTGVFPRHLSYDKNMPLDLYLTIFSMLRYKALKRPAALDLLNQLRVTPSMEYGLKKELRRKCSIWKGF